MKRWLLALVVGLAGLLPFAPARADEEKDYVQDARVKGFFGDDGKMKDLDVKDGGTTTTWLLFIFLVLLCVSVMFKSSRRTHLD